MVACCADSNRARSGWSILAGVGLAFGFTLWCAWFSQADSGSEKPSGPGMTMAAKAFVQSLDESQRATALMAFDSPERTRWHFVPLQDKDRNPTRKGLRLEKMNDAQREMALALLKSGTSERGYDEARQIMSLETVLDDLEKTKANVRNPLWYFVSIFGEPGDEKGWGWRFEGHHLTLNITLKGNQVVSATPSVFCSNPAVIKSGKKVGLATLPGTLSKAEALVESLSENQKGEARVKTLMAEVDQANAKAPAQPDEGIRWTALDDTQKKNCSIRCCANTPAASLVMSRPRPGGVSPTVRTIPCASPSPGKTRSPAGLSPIGSVARASWCSSSMSKAMPKAPQPTISTRPCVVHPVISPPLRDRC